MNIYKYLHMVLSVMPNGTEFSKGWVYRFLNESGSEQMGGLAVVFLSSHHKQKNNRTAGL